MNNVVSIVKGSSNPGRDEIKDIVRRAIDLIGGIENAVKPEDIVLIKPNGVGGGIRPGVATSAPVVEALVELVKEGGAKEVIIGEAESLTGVKWEKLGYKEVAERTGAKLLDFDEDEKVEIEVPEGVIFKKIDVSKTLLNADVIINVPVLKVNLCANYSGALKNWMGVFLKRGKVSAHMARAPETGSNMSGLHQAIVDINKAIKPRLTVIDGIVALEGASGGSGDSRQMNLIIAGWNPVAVDTVAITILGSDPYGSGPIFLASEQGLGPMNLAKIEVRGERIDEVKTKIRWPPTWPAPRVTGMKLILGDLNRCPTCVGVFSRALQRIQSTGKLDEIKELTVLLGPGAEPPEEVQGKLLVIGNCLRTHADRADAFVGGCPPQSIIIRDPIQVLCGIIPALGEYVRTMIELGYEVSIK